MPKGHPQRGAAAPQDAAGPSGARACGVAATTHGPAEPSTVPCDLVLTPPPLGGGRDRHHVAGVCRERA